VTEVKEIRPIFIFSLPRSGSTLLQRICASHPSISTVAEPWILLPYLYTLKDHGVYSEYGHSWVVEAVKDLCAQLPNGTDDYLQEMRKFVLRLYKMASIDGALFFLDKTPRYHLIARDVMRLFPDGKFIVLWRNPLAIIASMVETFGHKRWNVFRYKIDLFNGIENLVDFYNEFGSKLIAVQYEEFLLHPEEEAKRIFAALDIAWDPAVLRGFPRMNMAGRFGDPTGQKIYDNLSTEPLGKWKTVINNPWRKFWCGRYLKWVGDDRLRTMGYSLDGLMQELDAIPMSLTHLTSDLYLAAYGVVHCALEPGILKQKVKKLPEWKWVSNHE
jgi:Sulfotransferase family